jgi:hypothetical protein
VIQRETLREALENDRCGICGSVQHFREDCPVVYPATVPMEAVMPTLELPLDTRPLPKIDEHCWRCDIPLAAVPEPGWPYIPPGGCADDLVHVHRVCLEVLRAQDAGIDLAP